MPIKEENEMLKQLKVTNKNKMQLVKEVIVTKENIDQEFQLQNGKIIKGWCFYKKDKDGTIYYITAEYILKETMFTLYTEKDIANCLYKLSHC